MYASTHGVQLSLPYVLHRKRRAYRSPKSLLKLSLADLANRLTAALLCLHNPETGDNNLEQFTFFILTQIRLWSAKVVTEASMWICRCLGCLEYNLLNEDIYLYICCWLWTHKSGGSIKRSGCTHLQKKMERLKQPKRQPTLSLQQRTNVSQLLYYPTVKPQREAGRADVISNTAYWLKESQEEASEVF